MDKLIINGGKPLNGTISISGAKNAALPLMAACLLTSEPMALTNMSSLSDTKTMAELLQTLGVEVRYDDTVFHSQAANTTSYNADFEIVRKMRASIVVLGPLLGRFKRAKVSLPGGCAIGSRPVDLHLKALQKMGALIKIKEGYIHAVAQKGLHGARIKFSKVSVGATQNTIMAAVLAEGVTTIDNAAIEPENSDLCNMLVDMGAKIEGIGTKTLTITGVKSLHGTTHKIIPDRIETGTYAVAAAITGGKITIKNTNPVDIMSTLKVLEQAGVNIRIDGDEIVVDGRDRDIKPVNITTEPHPGFPTDMQAQLMALMTLAKGKSVIKETIFENRFMHAAELVKMGADITLKSPSKAIVRGVKSLSGAHVMATDLRASVALVLAGLVAEGETQVHRIYHLDRGYEKLESKLKACGADITRGKDT